MMGVFTEIFFGTDLSIVLISFIDLNCHWLLVMFFAHVVDICGLLLLLLLSLSLLLLLLLCHFISFAQTVLNAEIFPSGEVQLVAKGQEDAFTLPV